MIVAQGRLHDHGAYLYMYRYFLHLTVVVGGKTMCFMTTRARAPAKSQKWNVYRMTEYELNIGKTVDRRESSAVLMYVQLLYFA